MELLYNIVQSILGVGASALLPILICLLGLFFRVKFSDALKAGLLVGIGYQGVSLVVSFLVSTMNPIIEHYTAAGSGFTIIDVGWETLSAATWTVSFAALMVPLGLLINFILLRVKFVKTLNVDIWNYWHLIRSAALLSLVLTFAGVTGAANITISVIFGLFLTVFVEKVGDWIAPYWHSYFGLEGTTCTTILQLGTNLPIAWVTNKILDVIPGINKINLSYDILNDKIGSFANPTIVGFLLGLLLGVITGQDLTTIIKIGVGLSAAVTLTPRMVKLFMEGMSPISTAARDYMIKKLGDDAEFNVGVDIALGVGDETAITTSAIMIPIAIAMAFIFPGNNFFPTAFFGSSMLYMMATVCMVTKGNVFRSIVIGIVCMLFVYFSFNFTATLCTMFVENAGVIDIASGAQVMAGGMNNFIDTIIAFFGHLVGIN